MARPRARRRPSAFSYTPRATTSAPLKSIPPANPAPRCILRRTLFGPECRCLWGVPSSMPASARRKLYLPTSAAPHSTPTVRLWVRCIQMQLREFASASTSAPWVWTCGMWGIWGCGGGAPEPSHSHSCWTPPVRGRVMPERWTATTTKGGSRKLRPLAPTIIITTTPPFPPTTTPPRNGETPTTAH